MKVKDGKCTLALPMRMPEYVGMIYNNVQQSASAQEMYMYFNYKGRSVDCICDVRHTK